MEYKVLYRKYRPQNFNDLVGQDNIKELLLKSIINNMLSHAYIFTGPRGTGKTSTAKLFAKIVNCEANIEGNPCEKCSTCLGYKESPDIIEIDAASNNGVDEIRELRDNIKILPSFSKYKVYIVDEVHMLSTSAWNAFLKTLEEPPSHVIFILATTDIQKVPITVLSRCQRFDFRKINNNTIIERIKYITKKEKIDITSEAIEEIAYLSDGGLRDALSILDQLSKLSDKITIEVIKASFGIITNKELKTLFDNYFSGDIKTTIELLDKYNTSGNDNTIMLNKILNYLLNELIEFKISNTTKFQNIENLITDLESCYRKNNQHLMIKTYFLKNFTETPVEVEQKEQIKPKLCEEKIISREIISTNSNENFNKDILEIRINNSFVNANLNLKKSFVKLWKDLLNEMNDLNNFKYTNLLEQTKIEVVSPTNVLLSTESFSNSILFNSIADDLSEKINKKLGMNVKLICVDCDKWVTEKDKYIKNKDKTEYKLLDEPEKVGNLKTINEAEEVFGNNLIEIE